MWDITLTKKSFDALSSDSRIRILKLLNERQMTLSELARKLHMSKSTVSQHIERLLEAELVVRKQRGKWVYYALSDAGRKILSSRVLRVKIIISIGTVLILAGIVLVYVHYRRMQLKVVPSVKPPVAEISQNFNFVLGFAVLLIGLIVVIFALKGYRPFVAR